MSYYEKYEDALVSRLQMEGVEVSALPHVDALNVARPTTRPQLFVIINGGTFGEPEHLGAVAQLETVSGEVFVRALTRRGELGAFDLCDKAGKLLMGHRLHGAKSPITLGGLGYVNGVQNNWQYALTFSFTHYRVETSEAEAEQLIKSVGVGVDV
jgi:hypothetical protein